MDTNNKHICILICYHNYEHIVKCFESIKSLEIDFFIIENFSSNSHRIEEYFKKQNLVGYVQFEKNITNNAVNIIKMDFSSLFESYDYITFSDCDLFSEDPEELFKEIYQILEFDGVAVCCSSLSMDNLPNIKGSNSWIPRPISVHESYISTNTGVHFMTMKQKNYKLLDGVHFKDLTMSSVIRRNKRLNWVATKNNKVTHLTWDLYYEGSEYYQHKNQNPRSLWNHSNKCGYKIIV